MKRNLFRIAVLVMTQMVLGARWKLGPQNVVDVKEEMLHGGVAGKDHMGNLDMCVWKNPSPEILIDSFDFVSKGEGPMLGLVAVTGQE